MQKNSYLLHWIRDDQNLIHVKINSLNHLYLIISKINECIEETNGNEYLMLVPTDESNEC